MYYRIVLLSLISCLVACGPNSPIAHVDQTQEVILKDFSSNRVSEVAMILRWSPIVDNIMHYILYRETSEGLTQIAQLTKGQTLYLDTRLDPHEPSYSYTLEAYTSDDSHQILTLITYDMQDKDQRPYTHLITVPDNYETESSKDFPLLIFLHGAGERGTDLEKIAVHGPPNLQREGQDFPCIIVSPLCPAEVYWDVELLELLLKEIKQTHRIDTSRIYLTGLSMGGYGTWSWGIEHPEHFAALVPICGGGNPEKVAPIKDIPTWAFHGEKDNVVPISQSEEMVTALKAIGAEPKFTVYPEAGHDSWTEAYDTAELWEWMFQKIK